MFKTFIFFGLITLLLCISASAQVNIPQNRKLGLGIILGEPSGLSGKMWTGPDIAIDGGIAWSTGNNNNLNLHFDYLVHNFNKLNELNMNKDIILYYGVGTGIKFITDKNADTKAGIRIPIGINYLFSIDPIEIFLEVVPILDLIPGSEFKMNAGFGVRYYFQ
ncbi:DUF3996 domain-containing protein [Candidatus Desantisbacteria bacterium]|nr:DUF3996 domain-containing protein [Candidatus Desantisbacteria bacterium]